MDKEMKSNDEKKKLIEAYKQTKTERGVIAVRCKSNGKMMVDAMNNLRSAFTSLKMSLQMKNCWIRSLQEDFDRFGADDFEYLVLDVLKEHDTPGYDYRYDLRELTELWREKLAAEGTEFYNAKITKV